MCDHQTVSWVLFCHKKGFWWHSFSPDHELAHPAVPMHFQLECIIEAVYQVFISHSFFGYTSENPHSNKSPCVWGQQPIFPQKQKLEFTCVQRQCHAKRVTYWNARNQNIDWDFFKRTCRGIFFFNHRPTFYGTEQYITEEQPIKINA